MHRAAICDLQQPVALLFRQLAEKRDLAINAVDHRAMLFAMFAVSCVAFRMRQGGPYFSQRPSFAVRIHTKRHVGARSQCGQQVLVRVGACVVTANILRLIRQELMRADSYGLAQTRKAPSAAGSRHASSPPRALPQSMRVETPVKDRKTA